MLRTCRIGVNVIGEDVFVDRPPRARHDGDENRLVLARTGEVRGTSSGLRVFSGVASVRKDLRVQNAGGFCAAVEVEGFVEDGEVVVCHDRPRAQWSSGPRSVGHSMGSAVDDVGQHDVARRRSWATTTSPPLRTLQLNSGAEGPLLGPEILRRPKPTRRNAQPAGVLGNLPVRQDQRFRRRHASRARPINGYSDDIYTNPASSSASSSGVRAPLLRGHTHVPGVFLEGPDFYSPMSWTISYELTDEKAIITSERRQPRDRDPRSGFVVVTDTAIRVRPRPYDVDMTVRRSSVPELDNFLGRAARRQMNENKNNGSGYKTTNHWMG